LFPFPWPRNAAALVDDRQDPPSEYAEEKVAFAADNLIHDTADAAVSGTKTAVWQGGKLFHHLREKKRVEKHRENVPHGERPQTPFLESYPGIVPEAQQHQKPSRKTPEGRLPRQRTDIAPEQPHPKPFIERRQSGVRTEIRTKTECPSDAPDPVAEQGRGLAKERDAKRAHAHRQWKERSVPSVASSQPQGKTSDRINVFRPVSTAINHTVKRTQRTLKATRQVNKREASAVCVDGK